MTWTKELPTVEGWYWWWTARFWCYQMAYVYPKPDGTMHVADYEDFDTFTDVREFQEGETEWAGPLSPPPRP